MVELILESTDCMTSELRNAGTRHLPNFCSNPSIVIDLGLSMGSPNALDQTPCMAWANEPLIPCMIPMNHAISSIYFKHSRRANVAVFARITSKAFWPAAICQLAAAFRPSMSFQHRQPRKGEIVNNLDPPVQGCQLNAKPQTEQCRNLLL